MECVHLPPRKSVCEATGLPCPYTGIYIGGRESDAILLEECLFATDVRAKRNG